MRLATDIRVERTRAALMSAFTELVFANGFVKVRVRDIVARANVGRSTFYEHFQSREDILAACMARFLEAFADCVIADSVPERLSAVLDHLWSNRRLTDAIFTGAARAVLERTLTDMIERRMRTGAAPKPELLAMRLAATHLMEAQLGLVEAWLRGTAHCSPEALAEALAASSRGSLLALCTASSTARAGSSRASR